MFKKPSLQFFFESEFLGESRFSVLGDLTSSNLNQFEKFLKAQFEEGNFKLVLDLKKTNVFRSSYLSLINRLDVKFKKEDGYIRLTNCPEILSSLEKRLTEHYFMPELAGNQNSRCAKIVY